MMKNRIIYGVCAVVFLLCITPTIPAQQYSLVNDTIENDIQNHLNIVMTTLRKMDKDESQFEANKKIAIDSLNEIKQMINLDGVNNQPKCFKFIISTLISLIFAILGTLFGIIFGPALVLLIKVLTFPAVLLAKILSFIFNGNKVIAQ